MDLPIAAHNIEVKIKTIKKHIQYALEDLVKISEGKLLPDPTPAEILENLLDRMDDGTDDPQSIVPNREAGDLSIKNELQCLNNIVLTKRENYHV